MRVMDLILWTALNGASVCSAYGCGEPEHYGRQYMVVLDAGMSAAEQTAAVTAVDDWSRVAAGELELTFSVSDTCTYAFATICIHGSTEAALIAMGSVRAPLGFTLRNVAGDEDRADVYLASDVLAGKTPDIVAMTVAHELGHAMGLAHTTDADSSVMYPTNAMASDVPTCNDFAQWADLRGLARVTAACPSGGGYVLEGK